VSAFEALAFSTDSDRSTYSDSEQLAIRRIWQRVAEDYAPFDVDVTTERPASFNNRTAHALITPRTDANGVSNPSSSGGGVAYVGSFGGSNYGRYSPAWIYSDNLSGDESFIAEAVSHEIGHNMGLTHDGKTGGSDYYGGHGSGETSWGPVMGTGYNRNVSQWSKGEYYQASNTQDDLATIAGKLSYRADDHSGTAGSATPLVVGSGGIIAVTTPETDPANSSNANKGRIERSTDVDVFSFTTGAGPISLTIATWVVPGGKTRGGNVDLVAELRNAEGTLLVANNAPDRTGAVIQTNLVEGVYYLTVKSAGVGSPTASTPSGYTSYGSIGQYFISGAVVPNNIILPPGAELEISDITEPGTNGKIFSVLYTDDAGVNVSTIGDNDIQVTGPNGYSVMAAFESVDVASNGTARRATYRVEPPSGSSWNETHGGTYTVAILADAVEDTQGAGVPAGILGTFEVAVPRAFYFANMSTNPGWTVSGLWQFGVPSYTGGVGPNAGYTGTSILAYNLSGNYENRLSTAHATTPVIDASSASSLTLQFQRWLRVRNGDSASIQISTNGTAWTTLWSNNGAQVTDGYWTRVEYELPDAFARSSSLRLRWGMASGQNQNDIGWNIDDVALLGTGVVEIAGPVLNAPGTVAIAGGNVTLTAASTGTTQHVLEASSDFVNWVPVATNTPVSGSVTFQFTRSGPREFYRVSIP
jgi:hypothetical protein